MGGWAMGSVILRRSNQFLLLLSYQSSVIIPSISKVFQLIVEPGTEFTCIIRVTNHG